MFNVCNKSEGLVFTLRWSLGVVLLQLVFILSLCQNLSAQLQRVSFSPLTMDKRELGWDSPYMIGPQGNLQLSQDLSGFLDTSLKLTESYEVSESLISQKMSKVAKAVLWTKKKLLEQTHLKKSTCITSIDTIWHLISYLPLKSDMKQSFTSLSLAAV